MSRRTLRTEDALTVSRAYSFHDIDASGQIVHILDSHYMEKLLFRNTKSDQIDPL